MSPFCLQEKVVGSQFYSGGKWPAPPGANSSNVRGNSLRIEYLALIIRKSSRMLNQCADSREKKEGPIGLLTAKKITKKKNERLHILGTLKHVNI